MAADRFRWTPTGTITSIQIDTGARIIGELHP